MSLKSNSVSDHPSAGKTLGRIGEAHNQVGPIEVQSRSERREG